MGENFSVFLESYADCLNIAPFCVFFYSFKNGNFYLKVSGQQWKEK